MKEAEHDRWGTCVPDRPAASANSPAPLLHETVLSLDPGAIRAWVERLGKICAASALKDKKALTSGLGNGGVDVPLLFQASICRNYEPLTAMAESLKVQPAAFLAFAELVPLPLLQACARRWSSHIPLTWTQRYCPVCGAWPTLAESRGVERSRRLRCGRCGTDWPGLWPSCNYCGTLDHGNIVSLVPELNGEARRVEACKRCLGYVKSLSVLQGARPAEVLLEDLESVDLDVAAIEQGYVRPRGNGFSLDLRVAARSTAVSRFFDLWT